jgi:hypothetical protein
VRRGLTRADVVSAFDFGVRGLGRSGQRGTHEIMLMAIVVILGYAHAGVGREGEGSCSAGSTPMAQSALAVALGASAMRRNGLDVERRLIRIAPALAVPRHMDRDEETLQDCRTCSLARIGPPMHPACHHQLRSSILVFLLALRKAPTLAKRHMMLTSAQKLVPPEQGPLLLYPIIPPVHTTDLSTESLSMEPGLS